jgi:molybdopterin/thiamine biosynthesis adenylyltransferase
MPGVNIRIAQADWEKLRAHCSPSFRGRRNTEYGAIGILGHSKGREKHSFLVSHILWPEEGEVKAEADTALTFTSSYLRRAHLMMRELKLTGLITIHTHPGAEKEVCFSWYDDEQDPLLVENLQDIWPSTLLVSMVLGKDCQHARVWTSPSKSAPLANLIIVGAQFQQLSLDGKPPATPPKPSEIFDRAQALTGAGALSRLSQMTIAVVGASGTGSLMCELLARAGCKRILLIDHDVVKEVNRNRILYTTKNDSRRRRPKVEVIQRAIARLKLGCEVIPIVGTILDQTVLAQLNDADFIFGCVDKDYPRLLLSQYAYQYLMPYIDVGAEIGGDDEGIMSTDARTNYVAPGRPCLRCIGLVTSRRLRFESLTRPERSREIALGYSDDLLIKQPAVMDLNMRAASTGMMVLRHLLQPFLLPLPMTISENLVTYTMRAIRNARCLDPVCDICGNNSQAGFGDCGEDIGLAPSLATALLDS